MEDALIVGWLAGMIEGEGTIGWVGRNGVGISISMTDQDVVESLPTRTGLGYVIYIGKPSRFENSKPQWRWCVTQRDEVRAVLEAIRPLLGERRGARADAALERLKGNKGRATIAACGTLSGYRAHRRKSEEACRPCKAAQAQYTREFRAREAS